MYNHKGVRIKMLEEKDLEHTFNTLQNVCNELYETYGATEEVMSLQISINQLRHKFNVTDKSELLFEEFVQ